MVGGVVGRDKGYKNCIAQLSVLSLTLSLDPGQRKGRDEDTIPTPDLE